MNDWMHKIMKAIDHNRYIVAGLIVTLAVVGLTVYAGGCASKTLGLTTDQPVTRAEFDRQITDGAAAFAVRLASIEQAIAAYDADVAAFNANIDAGYSDLERQDAFKRQVLSSVGGIATQIATTGTADWTEALKTLFLVGGVSLGIGAGLDNRRKDTVIAAIKTEKNIVAAEPIKAVPTT